MQKQPGQKLIQSGERLSRSALWTAQKQFYIDHGIEIWRQRPAFLAAQAYMCDALASLCAAYLLDSYPTLKSDKPVYFVELGTGSGCFSYRFIRSLKERLATSNKLRQLDIRFVMTDIIPEIVSVWKNNERLAKMHDEGLLGFGVFDPGIDEEIICDGAKIAAFDNPPVFIANSLFDTIAVDGFTIAGGVAKEVIADLYAADGMDYTESLLSDQMRVRKRSGECVTSSYYNCDLLNSILADYTSTLDSVLISMPTGAFEIIQNIEKIASQGFALLICSKGYTNTSCLQSNDVLRYKDFSFPLNFDALRRYFELRGTQCMLPESDDISHIASFTAAKTSASVDLPATELAFAELSTTVESLRDLGRTLEQLSTQSSRIVVTLIAMMRLVRGDPTVFLGFMSMYFDALESEVTHLSEDERAQLIEVLQLVDANIYSFARKIGPPSLETSDDALASLINVWQRCQSAQPVIPDRSFFD